MRKILLYTYLLSVLLACSTSKQMEKAINSGNYNQAISSAISKLRVNKNSKRKKDIIIMLKDAYSKAAKRDLNAISFLKKDNNPENFLPIYDTYVSLNNRQELIKPLLPLNINGKAINFNFNNYTNAIIKFKNEASQQIYNNVLVLLNSTKKSDYRLAYNELLNIEDINPNYKDVRQLMDTAHNKGIDFVLVNMINTSNKIIPVRLEKDLLNFSNYGLNKFWTVYHSTPQDKVNYNFNMRVNLRDINISPEQIKERQIIKEKQITDGKKDLIENGKTVKDSLGNTIRIDNIKTVRCSYYEFTQFKATQVTGNVEYINLNTNQLVDAFPVSSEFIFEHIYATSTGDRRALNTNLIPFLELRSVPFPTAEQMVYDTGEDLKLQIKNIINSYNFN